MKKYLSLLLMLLFTACASDNEIEFDDKDYAVSATATAVLDGKIYYIDQNALWSIDENDEAARLIDIDGAKFISSNGTDLYIAASEHIYKYNADAEPTKYELSLKNAGSFAALTDYFVWTEGSTLKLCNISTSEITEKTALFGADAAVYPYIDDQILVLCFGVTGENDIYSFDTSTMSAGDIYIQGSYSSLAFDQKEGLIYLLSDNGKKLDSYNVSTGELLHQKPCEELGESLFVTISNKSAFIIKANGSLSIRRELSIPVGNLVTITVLTSSENEERLSELTDKLLDKSINLEIITEVEADKLKQKQLAGDSDYDLYFTDDSELVLDYPIYEPLDSYPEIVEAFELYFDEVKELCRYDGKLFGVPSRFTVSNTNILNCNTELLKELELELPSPTWTLKDFYELAVYLRDRGYYISPYSPLFLSDYARRYFDPYGTTKLNDNGNALREFLEITKKLRNDKLLYDKNSSDDIDKVLLATKIRTNYFVFSDETYCFIPTLDGERSYLITCSFLQMNANSQHKAEAAKVIAEYMKNPGHTNDTYASSMIFKDTSKYTYAPVTNRAEEYPSNIGELSEENLGVYIDQLKYSKLIPPYSEWNTFANAEAKKYYSDEQDIDTTVENILNRAKIILEE